MTTSGSQALTSVICAVYSKDPNRQSLLRGHAENLRKQSVPVSPIYVFENGDQPPLHLPGKAIVTSHPLTIYEAWNLAIEQVDTTYVMNLNLDDRLKTNAVEILQRSVAAIDADIVCGDWEICFNQAATDEVGEVEPVSALPVSPVWPPVPGKRVRMGSGTGENVTLGPATLWRHDLHSQVSSYPAYTKCGQPICAVADAIWWTVLIRFAEGNLHRCAEVIGHYHSHPAEQAEFRFPGEWDALRGKQLSNHLPARFYEALRFVSGASVPQKMKQTGGWVERLMQPQNPLNIDQILEEWHRWAGLTENVEADMALTRMDKFKKAYSSICQLIPRWFRKN